MCSYSGLITRSYFNSLGNFCLKVIDYVHWTDNGRQANRSVSTECRGDGQRMSVRNEWSVVFGLFGGRYQTDKGIEGWSISQSIDFGIIGDYVRNL